MAAAVVRLGSHAPLSGDTEKQRKCLCSSYQEDTSSYNHHDRLLHVLFLVVHFDIHAQTDNSRYTGYPLFKGLQRPLELMGLQGRYIYWAAGAVGGAILGFILAYCLIGFLAGLLTLVASLAVGAGFILLKQRKGLHSKKNDKGVFIYAYSKRK